ncbi:META domain-containing protein [Mucispirillum schaedleri]|uniref:META domain-containing protein n=1 Tax=Mucispirillum schaedleri TaxID=248039 RepID=UPI001F58627A|nr:META domain-containing protein [Mucispirillum schaedleri]
MKYFKLLLIILIIVPAAAFAAPKDVLNGKEFTSEKYPSILIGFKNGGVYGYALVNTYMGTYEIKDNNKIKFSYMSYTKMEGTREQNDGEYEYFSYLRKAKTYSYDSKTGVLIIDKMKFKQRK